MPSLERFNTKLLELSGNDATKQAEKQGGGTTNLPLTLDEYKDLANDFAELRDEKPKDYDRLWSQAEQSGKNLDLFDAFDEGLPYSAYLDKLGLADT